MPLLAISLLAILAGTLLLARFKKDPAGKFFSFISLFFIVVGFILFIGFAAGGICRLSHHCYGKNRCEQVMMMKHCGPFMPGMHCRHFGPRHMGPGMGPGMCHPGPCCMPGDSVMKCDSGEMMKCRHGRMMKCCKEGEEPAEE